MRVCLVGGPVVNTVCSQGSTGRSAAGSIPLTLPKGSLNYTFALPANALQLVESAGDSGTLSMTAIWLTIARDLLKQTITLPIAESSWAVRYYCAARKREVIGGISELLNQEQPNAWVLLRWYLNRFGCAWLEVLMCTRMMTSSFEDNDDNRSRHRRCCPCSAVYRLDQHQCS